MAVDVISVASAGITAYSFLSNLFPGQHTQGATVKIRTSTGTDPNHGRGSGNPNTGGDIRNVWGYQNDGTLLGKSNGGHISAGGQTDFRISQGNNIQTLYVDVVADNDAVCIPVIYVTQPDNGEHFGWSGDVFTACGLDNYYGNVDADGHGYMPRCGWLDANHDNIGQASMKWYLPAFSVGHGDTSYNKDTDFYCHPRPFEVRYDAQPIEKRSGEEISPEERRKRRRANLPVHELIMSPHEQHPASTLCEDETTVGPDFVSLHEGTFCDMGTKQWYSLCNEDSGLLDNCYDLNVANKTLSAAFEPKLVSALAQTLYSYELVTLWD